MNLKGKKWACVLTAAALLSASAALPMGTAAADSVLHQADFESGTGGWTSFGSSSVSVTSNAYHNGSSGLYVTGRTDTWHGTSCDMSSVMTAGETYQFEAWVMQPAAGETIQLMAKAAGEYIQIAAADAQSGTWVKLSGELTVPDSATDALIYFQTSGTSDFYVDDVTITGQASWSTSALDETPLKDIYANYFKIGCAATPAELSTVISQDVVKHHFNSVTLGNEMKPDSILDKAATQASGSNVNPVVSLDQAASVLKFCEQNNISVRGHVLVWHSQTPEWFFRENFSDTGAFVSKEVMSQRMENYIKNVMAAIEAEYPDLDLYCWDVVNECYMEDGSLRAAGTDAANGQSMWTMIYGDNSYIEEAFTYARKYAPSDCKLFYNDYNEYSEGKRDAIYNMVSDLKSKGLIDGIGMQSHLDTDYPSVDLYKQALAKYAELGLEIQVTELDITEYDQTAANIEKQNQMYGDIMQAIIDADKSGANITAVCFWGITDATSWRATGYPLLLDANYAPKQTFYEVANLIPESEWGDGSNPTEPETTEPTTEEPTTEEPTTEPPVPDGTTPLGDVYVDGELTTLDIVQMQKYLIGQTDRLIVNESDVIPDSVVRGGDMNQDNVINAFDLALLKKTVMNGK